MAQDSGLLDQAFSIVGTGIAAAVGLVVGFLWYLSVPGAIFGFLVALAIMAGLAIVLTGMGMLSSETAMAMAAVPAVASSAAASATSNTPSGITMVDSTLPPDAPIPATKIDATDTEAELLNAGRFAEYHLAKAKRLFEAKNFKEAAYQASASLAHGDLPEAVALRQAAKQAS